MSVPYSEFTLRSETLSVNVRLTEYKVKHNDREENQMKRDSMVCLIECIAEERP